MNFLIAMLMLGYLTYHIPKGGEKDSISNYFNISAYLKKVNEGITRWYRWRHSVQFNCSVMSDSVWPYELQHNKPPCPSPTPRVYSNSCPSNWWCHPTISSSVVPFSSQLQSLPASGSSQKSQFFPSSGQSTGVSASASVLPMNIQHWLPLGWTGWISLLSKKPSSLLQHHSSKASILRRSAFFTVQLSHPYMTNGKTIALTRWTFVDKVTSLLFNILCR